LLKHCTVLVTVVFVFNTYNIVQFILLNKPWQEKNMLGPICSLTLVILRTLF